MRRSRALIERHELVRLLRALNLGRYPARPPPAPVPEAPPVTNGAVSRRKPPPPRPALQPGQPSPPEPDDINQIPPGWEDQD